MWNEFDKQAAYRKGHPIGKVEAIGEALKTTPLTEERMKFIREQHWYHENQDDSEYILHDAKNGHRMLELRDKLLSFGGQEVCLPCYEQDLVNILDRGQLWLGDRLNFMKGLPSQCHLNSARCWDANRSRAVLCTGYALSEDGLWRQHSWCVHLRPRKNVVVETTVPRIAYWGFVFSEDEAEQFFADVY